MNGYVQAMSRCIRCGKVFTYNPHKVPSVRYPPPDGPREPVCGTCMEAINKIRTDAGLEPFEILPGAYDAMPEGEL